MEGETMINMMYLYHNRQEYFRELNSIHVITLENIRSIDNNSRNSNGHL